jgi:hypothetical protein
MPATLMQRGLPRASAVIAALLCSSAVAACGAAPVSAESSKSAEQIVRDSAFAVQRVSSFQISGSLAISGVRTVGFNLRIDGSDSMVGSLTLLGATGQFVAIDGASYLRGEDFFAAADGAAAALQIGDQWVELPSASTTSFEHGFSGFVHTTTFAACMVDSAIATRLSATTTTLNGAPAVSIRGGDTTMVVANTSRPFPLRIVLSGAEVGLLDTSPACSSLGSSAAAGATATGTINFADWGGRFAIAAPPTFIAAPTAAPAPSATQGVVYTDPQGRWRATFASEPTYTATTQPSPEGNLPYLYAEYAGYDVDELVGVTLLKPESTFNFSKALNGVATGLHGTIVSSVTERFRGYQAIEGVISTAGGFFKGWIIRAGAVIYILGTLGPVNPPSDFAGFVGSLTLTPH